MGGFRARLAGIREAICIPVRDDGDSLHQQQGLFEKSRFEPVSNPQPG